MQKFKLIWRIQRSLYLTQVITQLERDYLSSLWSIILMLTYPNWRESLNGLRRDRYQRCNNTDGEHRNEAISMDNPTQIKVQRIFHPIDFWELFKHWRVYGICFVGKTYLHSIFFFHILLHVVILWTQFQQHPKDSTIQTFIWY